MSDVAAFVHARLDEWEQAARICPRPDAWSVEDDTRWGEERDAVLVGSGKPIATLPYEYGGALIAEHIARHDPARVLAQVAAMRVIVDHYESVISSFLTTPDEVGAMNLCALELATIWSDHDDYDPVWSPDA